MPELPLWSAFSVMVRNSDFLTKLVRKKVCISLKKSDFYILIPNLRWMWLQIEDLFDDYIWFIFICKFKVRNDIHEGQILVCIYVKIWSEKSQNFNHFSQKSIVGALNSTNLFCLVTSFLFFCHVMVVQVIFTCI